MKLVIRGGRVIDPSQGLDKVCDIFIEDGKISAIEENIELQGGAEEIDARGMIVLPGFVDMHCHLRDPGQEYKEDIATGTKSAAAGGFTSVACMPNTQPPIDNGALVEYVKAKAKEKGYVNVFPIGCITKGQKGEELAEIGEMRYAGAVAVSDDGKPVRNPNIMRRALEYAAMFQLPVISHCEDADLADEGVMNEGIVSTQLGLKGIPSVSEEIIVAREILLAGYTKTAVHIAHVSTRGSVEIIRQAKKKGVRVTCETCPHYFSLTEEACMGFNTLAKVNPPLRTADDVIAIKEGLRDGTIDVIATDHAPHHFDEKNVEFASAASGLVGFETALPLAVTFLVSEGILTWNQLAEKMSYNPSRILGLDKGTLQKGKAADITVIDPEKKITVDITKFKSKSKNSPYDGYELKGAVIHTIVDGVPVVRDGELITKKG